MAIAVVSDGLDKTRQWWENYFAEGGGWEFNGGRQQSRIFAEHFARVLPIERNGSFSLLDVGCALGDGIDVFSREFSNAKLLGVDFSTVAVKRCQRQYGSVAQFAVGDIDSVVGSYDLIYCSNTLEHFANFVDMARSLTAHCKRLCILVPYEELYDGRPLQPNSTEHHQATFHDDSFDGLIREGVAVSIDRYVFSAPGAWGWTPLEKVFQQFKNLLRPFFKRPVLSEPLQVFYDIKIRPQA